MTDDRRSISGVQCKIPSDELLTDWERCEYRTIHRRTWQFFIASLPWIGAMQHWVSPAITANRRYSQVLKPDFEVNGNSQLH